MDHSVIIKEGDAILFGLSSIKVCAILMVSTEAHKIAVKAKQKLAY